MDLGLSFCNNQCGDHINISEGHTLELTNTHHSTFGNLETAKEKICILGLTRNVCPNNLKLYFFKSFHI